MSEATSANALVDRTLARLRAPDSPHVDRLAVLVVQDFMEAPASEVVDLDRLSAQVVRALQRISSGDAIPKFTGRVLERIRSTAGEHDRVEQAIPAVVSDSMREVLSRPYTPSPELVRRLVAHESVRDLIGRLLEDAVRRFADRMRALDQSAGGLGSRAARRGKRFGRGILAAAGVADVATDFARSLSDEIESAMDQRVRSFVAEATNRAAEGLVDDLTSPEAAEAFTRFRLDLWDEFMSSPTEEMMVEVERLDAVEASQKVSDAIARFAARPEAVDQVRSWLGIILTDVQELNFGAWLDELNVAEPIRELLTDVVASRIRSTTEHPVFAVWLGELLSD